QRQEGHEREDRQRQVGEHGPATRGRSRSGLTSGAKHERNPRRIHLRRSGFSLTFGSQVRLKPDLRHVAPSHDMVTARVKVSEFMRTNGMMFMNEYWHETVTVR